MSTEPNTSASLSWAGREVRFRPSPPSGSASPSAFMLSSLPSWFSGVTLGTETGAAAFRSIRPWRHVERPRENLSIEIDIIAEHGLRAAPPLVLKAVTSPNGMLTIENPEFEIFAASETTAELKDLVINHLAFIWTEYALESPTSLTEGALALRQSLLNRFVSQSAE